MKAIDFTPGICYNDIGINLKGGRNMSRNKKNYPWNKSRNDSGAENEVYAGPEYFEKLHPVEIVEEPSPMEGVYAGPFVPPMACVYAGPEYFSGNNGGNAPGAPAPAAQSGRYCVTCGTPVKESFKFCPCCGAPLQSEE